jgi:flagellar FliJ protein
MRFKFSLEKVLNHRKIQEDLAQKEFLDAQINLNKEIDKKLVLIEQKENSIKQRRQSIQSNQSWVSEVEQINLFLIGQDIRISQQNQRLLEFEKIVEEKREILRKAMIEVKIMDKLKEKKYEEFKKSELTKEQNELDELSVLRFSKIESLIKGSHEDGI